MRFALKFTGVLLLLGVFAHFTKIWYNVFVVGEYYKNADVLGNIFFGGLPLWMLLISISIILSLRRI